jgi:hypothetical protein
MGDRGATPPIPGILTGFVDMALQVAYFELPTTLTRASFRVTDAPSTGTVTVELNTESDGSGANKIEATIADGTWFITATGTVTIPAGGALYQFVTAESGSAMNLSGEYEIESVSGVTTFLTTLALVKLDAEIAGTDADRDTVLNSLIAGVSKQMQNWMDRPIVQSTATDEKIDSAGSNIVQTRHYPIISISSLTELDTALVEDTGYEIEEQDKEFGQIGRIADEHPTAWARGRRVVKVTYSHGYASVPDDLVSAATALVVARYFETKQSGKGWRGLASKGVDPNSSVSYDKEIWTRETIPAMQPYHRVMV